MADGGIALVILTHYHSFGQGQRQAQIDFAVVQDVGLELDTVSRLAQVLQQLRLMDAQPAEQRQHDAVGMPGEVGEEDLQVEAVFERKR
ncbi:hypothetical protein D3C84_1059710 [compost metagenome]